MSHFSVSNILRAALPGGTTLPADCSPTIACQASRFIPSPSTSPHSAFYSEAALRESQTKAATQIVKVLSGEDADYAIRP